MLTLLKVDRILSCPATLTACWPYPAFNHMHRWCFRGGWGSILQRSLFVSIVHKKLNPIGIRSGFEPGTSWIQVCYNCFSTDLLNNKPFYRKRNKYTSKSVSRHFGFGCLHLTRTARGFLSSAAIGCSVHFVVQGLSFISIGTGARTSTFGDWSATLQVRGRSAVVRKPQVLSFGTRALVQSGG